jgi:hypothetical protein
MDTEVFKLTYQFLLIVVVGGALSVAYKELEARRARRDAERDLQRKLQTDVARTYNTAKKIRRLLRAKAADSVPVKDTTPIRAAPYNELMQELNETQLEFEFLKKQAGNLCSNAPDLAAALEAMESYLHEIVRDWEIARLPEQQGTLRASELKHLLEFIGPHASATTFRTSFQEPFEKAIFCLDAVITDQALRRKKGPHKAR